MTQVMIAKMPASGPNAPPVNARGPARCAAIALLEMERPETAVPKTGPSKKFHAKCKPIGNHRLRVRTKAAPSNTPASSAIASDEIQVGRNAVQADAHGDALSQADPFEIGIDRGKEAAARGGRAGDSSAQSLHGAMQNGSARHQPYLGLVTHLDRGQLGLRDKAFAGQ